MSRRASRIAAPLTALVALASCAALAPAVGAQAPTPTPVPTPTPTPAPGSASALLQDCHVAVDQADRSATFVAQMGATTTTQRMEERVQLLERASGDAGYSVVNAPGLGVWRRSAVGVQVYRYVKQVTNLPAPGVFRATVAYRWLDQNGQVIRRATHRSPICAQPDERPLLSVGPVSAAPAGGSSSSAQYEIPVLNSGRGPAGPFDVVLTVNGTAQPDLTIPELAADSRTVLDAVAPRCTAGSTVLVTVDPQHQIDEAAGGGQPKTIACPFKSQSAGGNGSSSSSNGGSAPGSGGS